MEVEISKTEGVTIRPVFFPLLPTGSNDFPADGADDPILWNQQTGVWTLADGRTWNMGGKHGWPVPGDYNGDGEMEPAAWLPKQSLWRVRGQFDLENFGQTGDFPVPGDYDGDGKTDPALYRQSTGEWLISFSSTRDSTVTADVTAQTSPVKGVPVPGDYDGDGKIEGAVYDADSFTWFIPGQPNVEYGHPGFVPVPADYNGDGITDLAIANIAKGFYLIKGGKRHDVATKAGDIPSMIDYDGDGTADFSWYRPSEGVWYFDDGTSLGFGGEEDMPVTR
jgi:hypothetical protein